jgi:general secretion pathway protein K
MDAMTQNRQHGMVLVIVLWIVTLLAVMAGGFAYSMRVETRLATSAVERTQARALAEAGVAYALAWQLDPEAQKQWSPNGDPHDWEFGGGRVRISVEDAAGRIGLNNADPQLLQQILVHIGMTDADAEKLAAVITDWRDPDDQTQPGGAEKIEYHNAGREGPKNAPFESIEELPQVLGMNPDTAQRLAGLATTETLVSGINPQLASLAVLRAATGLDEPTLADYVSARARAASEGAPPPSLPTGDGPAFFTGSRSGVYHIAVTAQAGPGATVSAETVVSTQNPPQGQVARWLSWRLTR